jgi:hypothetical protein
MQTLKQQARQANKTNNVINADSFKLEVGQQSPVSIVKPIE